MNATLWPLISEFLIVTLLILLLVAVAVVITLNASRFARWLVRMNRAVPGRRDIGDQRTQTLTRLYASFISLLAVLLVIIGILRIFVDPSQIVWIIGLFSAGFGLGARVLVSDLISGGTYIFRNTFSIGEKAEFVVGMNKIEGIVEDVNMRSTQVRAPTGELYTLPNGEIGIIRNFTRGHFSGAQIRIKVPTAQLLLAIETLHSLGEQAMALHPEQIEPWQILLAEDEVGTATELKISAKYTYGNAASLKPQLAALIYQGLAEVGVEIPE